MQETLATSTLSVPSRSSISTQDKFSTAGQTSSTGPRPPRHSIVPPPSKSKGWNSGTKFHQMRRTIAEDTEWSLAIVPLLTELCIQHIVKNFQSESVPALGRRGKPGLGQDGWGLPRGEASEAGSWGSPSPSALCPHPCSTLPFPP